VNAVGINTFQENVLTEPAAPGDRIVYLVSFPVHLRPGVYSVSPSIPYSQEEARWMDYVENAVVFTVVDALPKRLIFGVYLPPERSLRMGHHRSAGEPAATTNTPGRATP
jgi:hypothetical protein